MLFSSVLSANVLIDDLLIIVKSSHEKLDCVEEFYSVDFSFIMYLNCR